MKQFTPGLIVAILIAIAPHSLAPILEEALPTPSSKSKPKPQHTVNKSSPERSVGRSTPEKAVSFAGTWKGTASGPGKQALIGTTTLTSNYNLTVSPDEKQINWTSSLWMFSRFQAQARKSGRTLNWTYQRQDVAGQTNIAVKMEMNSDGTATLMEYSGMTNGAFKGYSYQLTGKLIRQ
jgi:hypothetical protein